MSKVLISSYQKNLVAYKSTNHCSLGMETEIVITNDSKNPIFELDYKLIYF